MIEFDTISFSYSRQPVLRDVSFSIRFDEQVAILGESGEGKTTILRLIMGLIKPDSGRIIIDGEDITGKSENEMREARMKFSIVFQEGALFDSLNVKENVAFCLREYSDLQEEEIHRQVAELLKTVGMEEALYLMPEELSGGMLRRVAIARSLAACQPRMFLYDEPTSGLDPINADNICKLIGELSHDGIGHIVVTHKIFDAMKIATRFMFLKNGQILFDGNRQEMLRSMISDIQLFLRELECR